MTLKGTMFFLSEAPGDEDENEVDLPNETEDDTEDNATDSNPPEEESDPSAEDTTADSEDNTSTEDDAGEEDSFGEDNAPDATQDEEAIDKDIDSDSTENIKIHALYERFEENERVLISIREVLQDLQARKLDDSLTSTILTVEKEVNDLIEKVKMVLDGDFNSDNYTKMLTVFTYVQSSINLVDKILNSFLEEKDDKTKDAKTER